MSNSNNITSVLRETRVFQPSADFSQKAHVRSFAEYKRLWESAREDIEGFWAEQAKSLAWFKTWHTTLEWKAPHAKWFDGGLINASYNCLDRHLGTPTENRKAIMTISHGFESMNVNIMSHFRAVNAMAHTDSLPLFPKSFPVMLTKATTASDVQRSMNQIAGTELSEQQTIVLLTMIQNELISTGNF